MPSFSCTSSSSNSCATPTLPSHSFSPSLPPLPALSPTQPAPATPYHQRSLARSIRPSAAAHPPPVLDTPSKNLWASIRSKVGGMGRGGKGESSLPRFVVEESAQEPATIGGRRGSKSERFKAAAGTVGKRWRKGTVKEVPVAEDESFVNVSPTPSNLPEPNPLAFLFSIPPTPPPRSSPLHQQLQTSGDFTLEPLAAQPMPSRAPSPTRPSVSTSLAITESATYPLAYTSSVPSLSFSGSSIAPDSADSLITPSGTTSGGLNILLPQQLDTQIPSPRLSLTYFGKLPSPIPESPPTIPSAESNSIEIPSSSSCRPRDTRREGFILGSSSSTSSSPFVSPPTSPPGILRKSVRSLGDGRTKSTQGGHRSKKSLTNPNLLSSFPPPTSPLPPLPPTFFTFSPPVPISTPITPALPTAPSPYLRPSAPTPNASSSSSSDAPDWSRLPSIPDTIPPSDPSIITLPSPPPKGYSKRALPQSTSTTSSSRANNKSLAESTRIPRRPKTLEPSTSSSLPSTTGTKTKKTNADVKAGSATRRHPLSLSGYSASRAAKKVPRKVTPPTSHPEFGIEDPFAAPY